MNSLLKYANAFSLILQKFDEHTFGEFLYVLPFGDDVRVLHRVVQTHALELHCLMHVTQAEQLHHVVQVDYGDQKFLAKALQPVETILIRGNEDIYCLISCLQISELIRVNEFKQLLEGRKADVLHRND